MNLEELEIDRFGKTGSKWRFDQLGHSRIRTGPYFRIQSHPYIIPYIHLRVVVGQVNRVRIAKPLKTDCTNPERYSTKQQ
jgi:hypothetical protein